jgi:hypothetical protein
MARVVNARCGTCGQVWHVCDLPQKLTTAARLMRAARCPNSCAGQVFMAGATAESKGKEHETR